MAQAVMEMFPGQAKFAIGPPIENGFYYDFDLPRPLTPEDLERLEKRMREILAGKYAFQRRELSAQEARQLFADQPYKIELIDGLERGGTDEYGEETSEKPVISTYTHDTFTDLCRGPHVENTGQINPQALKLLSVAGASASGALGVGLPKGVARLRPSAPGGRRAEASLTARSAFYGTVASLAGRGRLRGAAGRPSAQAADDAMPRAGGMDCSQSAPPIREPPGSPDQADGGSALVRFRRKGRA